MALEGAATTASAGHFGIKFTTVIISIFAFSATTSATSANKSNSKAFRHDSISCFYFLF